MSKYEPLYLYVPDWYANLYNIEKMNKMVMEMANAERMAQDSGAAYEMRRRLKDTKPDFLIDDSIPGRVVITVGAGEVWREDLKDMGERTKEKANPMKNPDLQRDLKNDLDTAVWAGKRKSRDAVSVAMDVNMDYKERDNGTAS